MRFLFAAAFLAVVLATAGAQETPPPGAAFDRWVRTTFFGGYRPTTYNSRWDVPASANSTHGGVPLNLKTARLGTAIELGEALRQYEIEEPFMLVIGFWEQEGKLKRVVNIVAPVVSPDLWRKLWGPVTYSDLQRLEALIKDTGPTVEEIRRRALRIKNSPPFTEAIIQINPRIDDQGQRRLQCSLRFADVFAHLAKDASPRPQEQPMLFGTAYPGGGAVKAQSANQD